MIKTIEQACYEYAKKWDKITDKQIGHYNTAKLAFKAGAEFAQKWYDVNEVLPRNDTYVFRLCGDRSVKEGKYGACEFYMDKFLDSEEFEISDVTHWRPINLE
jgi:hypothetical protein